MDFYNIILPGKKYLNLTIIKQYNDNLIYIPYYDISYKINKNINELTKIQLLYNNDKYNYDYNIASRLNISDDKIYSDIKNSIINNMLSYVSINPNNNNIKSKIINISNIEHIYHYIPCILLLTNDFGLNKSNDIILYYHGNSECIFDVIELCKRICINNKKNVLIIEYPNYSIYKGVSNQDNIYSDSIMIYDYLKSKNIDNIYAIGRSIGTAPVIYLAAKRKLNKIILISPFLSIQNIIKDLTFNILKYLVKEKFNNNKYINNVTCPILFIHGYNDKLIPLDHSKQLKNIYDNSIYNNTNSNKYSELLVIEDMDHNINNINKIIIQPVNYFFN